MNSGGSNNVSLKYERYAWPGCWDLGIIKLGFVEKTQFLYATLLLRFCDLVAALALCTRMRKANVFCYIIQIQNIMIENM